MSNGRKVVLAALVALAALTIGVGYAFAQTTQTTTTGGEQQDTGTTSGSTSGSTTTTNRAPCADRRHLVAGEVVKVEDNVITVKTSAGEEKTAKVDDKTVYRKDGGDATLADVQPGVKVGIKLYEPEEGDEQTAQAVMIGEPQGWGRHGRGMHGRGPGAVGEVTAVDGDTVTVKTADGEKQFKLPGIKQGSRIGVLTGPDGAVRGVLYDPPETPQAAAGNQAQTSTGASTSAGGQNA